MIETTTHIERNEMICRSCGRDINAIGQDNMSLGGRPLCEDCAGGNDE